MKEKEIHYHICFVCLWYRILNSSTI